MKVDILIKNGRVIDPARNMDEIAPVTICRGKIVASEPNVEASQVVDAKGCIVIPGMIDHHTHCNYHATDIGVPVDIAMLPGGVTTAVDAGSSGVSTARAFLDNCTRNQVKTKIYVHVSPLGMSTCQYQEILKPEKWSKEQFEDIFSYGGDRVLGLKMKVGKMTLGEIGIDPFYDAVKMADALGTRLVIHPTEPVAPLEDILNTLRKDDTLAHVYNSRGDTIYKDGHVIREAWEAAQRGVKFDVAHGGMNLSFDIAEKAISDGFLPDFISSDCTMMSWNKAPVYNLLNVMSKFLMLGLDLHKVIDCVTAAPAQHIGEAGRLGTLAPGACGDVAVLRLNEGKYRFIDADQQIRFGDKLLMPWMTIANGEIVYRSAEACVE